MSAYKIAFFDAKPYDIKSFDALNLNSDINITYFETHLSAATVDLAAGFGAVCAFVNDTIDAEVIQRLYDMNVRMVAMRCAGYNNVDFKAAFNKVHVVRVPDYSPYAVAEHAMALILGLNRKTHKAYYRTRDGNFNINGLLGFDLHSKYAGVVGTGKIGRCLIDILKGFGMKILAYDPFPNLDYAKETGVEFVSLDRLFAESDVISLHCPLNADTEYLINKQTIAQLKPGVLLINTGRGKLIHSQALIQGLKSGRIGGAGLDVYEEEEAYFFEDRSADMINDDVLARLMTFPNVLITSHQAFFTREALYNIGTTTLSNLNEYFSGQSLTNEICYRCTSPCPRGTGKPCF